MGQERDAGNGARLAAAETSSTALGRCEGQFRDLCFAKPASNCFFAGKASNSSFHRGVKNAIDLHDIVVKQALRLDHCARWKWRLAPELRLHLVHHRRETVQVTDVNRKPHTILKAGALRLGNQSDVEKGLADPGAGILHQFVGCGIYALHAGDKDQVAGPGAETPGALDLDSAGGVECFDAVWRGCLRKTET